MRVQGGCGAACLGMLLKCNYQCRAAWAAGTGYGSDLGRTGQASAIWDAKHAEASQAAQDAELEKLLIHLATS